jgi:hypothetical protein
MAHLESVAGDVLLQADPAKPDMGLIPGQEIHTRGKGSYAVLKVSDGTRLFLSADTSLKLSSDLKAGANRSFHLSHGTVRADVAKQPAASPMIFTTATAEARVVGTDLVLSTSGDATRLEVRSGKVRLIRREDNAGVDVAAGHSASVPKSGPLAAKLSRATAGLQALYLFQETQGGIVHDVSGAGVPLDLRMVSPKAASWTAPGMNLTGNTRIDTEVPAARIIDACRKTQELTLEAWVQPSKAALDFQGVIVALSTDVQDRNFSLAQNAGSFESTIRTSTTDGGGRPPLASGKATVETKLTHLVFTRTAAGQERLYVNGVEKASRMKAGNFTTWTDAHRLYIGNESFEERPWGGTYRLVAVYSQSLSPADVARHFKLGVD